MWEDTDDQICATIQIMFVQYYIVTLHALHTRNVMMHIDIVAVHTFPCFQAKQCIHSMFS